MNTDTFIRHYTRKILAEARVRKRLGGISRGAREALGLADSKPAALLQRIGIPLSGEFTVDEILRMALKNDILSQAFSSDVLMTENSIEVYVNSFDDSGQGEEKLPPAMRASIVPAQAPRYLKALLNACINVGILKLDSQKIEYALFEEGEKLLVKISGI